MLELTLTKNIEKAIKKYPNDYFYLSDISTFGFDKSEKFSDNFDRFTSSS